MKRYIIIPIIIIFNWRCTFINEPENGENNSSRILSETITLINHHYPYLEFKNINIDSLHEYYESRLSHYEGDGIYRLLHDLLSELKDGHVWLYTPGGALINTYTPRRRIKDRYSYDPEVVRKFFSVELILTEDERIEYGITSENIGYIYISTMERDDYTWIYQFSNTLRELIHTKGLVLDVRHNSGGSETITGYIISYFISEPILSSPWLDANGNELERRLIMPNSNLSYQNNVVVLQNGKCFSATEGFINTMREISNVTTLGDTTAGGSGAPKDFLLSDGLTIHLSTKAQLTYDGMHIEWNGLEPDILIPQNRTILEGGIDIQLEEAIKLLSR